MEKIWKISFSYLYAINFLVYDEFNASSYDFGIVNFMPPNDGCKYATCSLMTLCFNTLFLAAYS